MKKVFLFFVLVFCFGMLSGQSEKYHHVIVVMEQQYDNVELSRKTQFMDKAQQREFAINDHKAFCQASQADVMDFAGSLGNEVQEVHPFWSVNAFGCMATDEAIQLLEARHDVALVIRDEFRKMLPGQHAEAKH